MHRNPFIRLVRNIRARIGRWPDSFLWDVDGALHIGANTGQERHMYANMGLVVVWVEPIPEVFNQLSLNLQNYPNQHAVKALVSSLDGESILLNVASNNGESSSILAPGHHLESWPEVKFGQQIQLNSISLSTLVRENCSHLPNRSALILDTQGSELMILQGGSEMISRFQYVKVEAPDFEAYVGCPTASEIIDFMAKVGFVLKGKFLGAESVIGKGKYFDLVFSR